MLNDGGPHYRWDKARPITKEDGERERKEEAEAKKPEAAGGGNFRIPPKSEGAGHPVDAGCTHCR